MLKAIFQAADRADQRINNWMSSPSQPAEVREQATAWGTWAGDQAATTVTQSNALKLLAVTGSIQLLTDSISTLPVDVFRSTGTRAEVAKPQWLVEPVVGLTFTDWCTQVMTSLLLHGNAYLVVTRNTSGRVVEVVPVDPQTVTVDRGGSMGGRKRYIVNGRPFTGEMLHIKGMMLPGTDVGLSPLDFAHQSIQLGLSAQDYGVTSFDAGLKMPGVIEYPGVVDPAKMSETARLWQRARRKGGHGLPGVLEGGGTFKAMGITNEAAQFLQTRQWTAAEICAQVYLIDPRELGIPLTGSTLEYVNSESRLANLVRKGMLRWITRIEAAATSLLGPGEYFKFNVNAFQRADSGERWSTYEIASRINTAAVAIGMDPVLDTTEMRGWEELDPLPSVDDDAEDLADQLNIAEIIQKIYLGVDVVVSDEEARDILRAAGANLIGPMPSRPVDTAMRSDEIRAADAARQPVVNVTVDARQEPPVVNVENRMEPMQAPAVTVVNNVEPTPVTIDNHVDVSPTPVTVTNDVQPSAAVVNVEVPLTRHRVHRDAQGNIVEVSEEPV